MATEDYNFGAPIYLTWRVNWCTWWLDTCFNNFQCNLHAPKSVGTMSSYSIHIFLLFLFISFFFKLALSNRCPPISPLLPTLIKVRFLNALSKKNGANFVENVYIKRTFLKNKVLIFCFSDYFEISYFKYRVTQLTLNASYSEHSLG